MNKQPLNLFFKDVECKFPLTYQYMSKLANSKFDTFAIRNEALGNLGEYAVMDIFNARFANSPWYKSIDKSKNKYDSEKDMTLKIDYEGNYFDYKTEVKTQVPYILERAFTVRTKQGLKCSNADLLIFISVDGPKTKTPWCGEVYCLQPKHVDWKPYLKEISDARMMLAYPIEADGMQHMYTIKDENILGAMTQFTQSKEFIYYGPV